MPKDWTYCQSINDNMYLYYTPLEDSIMIGLHVLEGSFGWSALGPGGNGGMKGASQIVVRKNDDDEWVAEDRYSTDYSTPTLDESQDIELLFAQQDDVTGETSWGVVLPQNSCDERDYPLDEDHNVFMIYALGSTHDFNFHGGARGQFTANLLGLPPNQPNMDDYDHVDLVMPNVSVVRGEEDLDPTNPFICSYFDMEVLGEDMGFTAEDKVHMVGYEPVITEGNEKYLHHFTMFSCEGYAEGTPLQQQLDDSHLYHQKVLPSCTNMPPGCTEFLGGWAVGSNGHIFPHNVGVGIGEGKRWLVVQNHYYNPNMDTGIYDSSGIRLHLTKDLRPIDAGVMSFAAGVSTGQHPELPGGQKDVAMETLFVEPDCSSEWSGPLTVMSVQHHSHYMGLHQEIVVERDGKNLGALRTEHIYDYNHQGGVEPNTAVRTLLPGDRISATCHFDTTSVSANSTVQIGEESNKEMCFPTIFYYPKQEVDTYAYYPPAKYSKLYVNELEWCRQPSMDEDFESQCAEKLYNDVPGFSSFFSTVAGYDGPSFNYPTLCNGGALGAKLREQLPDFCPTTGCTETQDCSEEVLKEWAKGVCEYNCGKIGLSLYPDTSRTEPFNTSNVACPTSLFDKPTLAEPESCQKKGSLSSALVQELANKIDFGGALERVTLEENSSAGLVWNYSLALVMCMLGSTLLL